jgi:hypothetical protein
MAAIPFHSFTCNNCQTSDRYVHIQYNIFFFTIEFQTHGRSDLDRLILLGANWEFNRRARPHRPIDRHAMCNCTYQIFI